MEERKCPLFIKIREIIHVFQMNHCHSFSFYPPHGAILPLEAKAGINPKSKSLRTFDEKFHPERLLRTTLLNLRRDGKIPNIPLYALTMIGKLSV